VLPEDIARYFSAQSADAKLRLNALRRTIKRSAPDADECISYKIPAFRCHGMLVWYAAFKSHIGFYPGVACVKAFRHELAAYKVAKGSVQFPIDRPLPLDIIAKMVAFKLDQNVRHAREKGAV
jgi:uncharacterized protein YdhG (YjbR/CyaY superfamily)